MQRENGMCGWFLMIGSVVALTTGCDYAPAPAESGAGSRTPGDPGSVFGGADPTAGANVSGGTGGAEVQCRPCVNDADCGDGQSAGCWLPVAIAAPVAPSGGDEGGGGSHAGDEEGEEGDGGHDEGAGASTGGGTAAGFCARDCTATGACPSGSTCVADVGDAHRTCVPVSGSCDGTGTTGTVPSPGTVSNGCTSDTWTSSARAFFQSQCTSCHGWAGSQTSVRSKASSISATLQSGSMPPNRALAGSERQRILTWLGCGAP